MNRPGEKVPKTGLYFCDNCGRDPHCIKGRIFPPCPTENCGEEITYTFQDPNDVEDSSNIQV